jgi:hypothetical protein
MKLTIARTAMLSAAALMLGAVAVNGETRVTAKVPFDFQVGRDKLPAGNYSASDISTSAARIVRISKGGHSIMAIGLHPVYENSDGRARMEFVCNPHSGCALVKIWNGAEGVAFAKPKLTPAEKESLAVVYFERKDAGQ